MHILVCQDDSHEKDMETEHEKLDVQKKQYCIADNQHVYVRMYVYIYIYVNAFSVDLLRDVQL